MKRTDPNYDTLHELAMDLPQTRVPGLKPGDRVVLEFLFHDVHDRSPTS
jgi:hypothetical protein